MPPWFAYVEVSSFASSASTAVNTGYTVAPPAIVERAVVLSTPRPFAEADVDDTAGSTTVMVEPDTVTHIFSSWAVPGATTTKNLPVGHVDGEVDKLIAVCVADVTPDESRTAETAAPLYDLRIFTATCDSYS